MNAQKICASVKKQKINNRIYVVINKIKICTLGKFKHALNQVNINLQNTSKMDFSIEHSRLWIFTYEINIDLGVFTDKDRTHILAGGIPYKFTNQFTIKKEDNNKVFWYSDNNLTHTRIGRFSTFRSNLIKYIEGF
jgi:hypothetical protein